jgi:hypothetical protein
MHQFQQWEAPNDHMQPERVEKIVGRKLDEVSERVSCDD